MATLLMRNRVFCLATAIIGFACRFSGATEPRLNQIQVIGTHNSYHVTPHEELMKLLSVTSKKLAASIDYSHRPLAEQFATLGIRQIELDVFNDPKGGLFAEPSSIKTLKTLGREPGPDPNAGGVLSQPGLKVLHVQDVDYRSTTPTFKIALEQVRAWSQKNPRHVPIFILVELKDGTIPGLPTKPAAFDDEALDRVDAEIDAVFQRSEIFTPDDLRGDHKNLTEAIRGNGWPELAKVRGKVIFALDNEGKMRDSYIKGHENLSNRRLFVTPPAEDHPAAAFFKINDPVKDFERIQRLVRSGFIIRTRADADTKQSRTNDPAQREKALASGAQMVSTDYPEPRREFSEYRVRLPGNVVARANPLSGGWLDKGDLETTGK